MCGIVGVLMFNDTLSQRLIEKMTNELRHRGPDDEGYLLIDSSSGSNMEMAGKDTIRELKLPKINEREFQADIAFGHRRLAIIDLSSKAHQPMNVRRNWIVYNGEIYNYIELREELKKRSYKFKSNSDTEVILNAYNEWEEDCLTRLNGMFAFAIYNADKKKLFLARDRFGLKPLYFYKAKNKFVFASEIKSILQDETIERKANEAMIFDFLTYGLTDLTEETFFKNIYRLLPGHFITIDIRKGEIKKKRWWWLRTKKINSNFMELLSDSIKIRMRSDVPIGTCLSGGLDSSYIVFIMADLLGGKQTNINTFSAVYGRGKPGDETEYIDIVIKKTGAKKHTIVPDAGSLKEDIRRLIYHQEEPFGSTSIYAQWEVMKLAKRHEVKVLLDGQGADEQLAGYRTFFGMYYSSLMRRLKLITLAKELYHYLKIHKNFKIFSYIVSCLRGKEMKSNIENSKFLMKKEFYDNHMGRTLDHCKGDLNNILKFSLENSLQELLRFEDKNSMAFSIETRLPYLDYRLSEFIYSLPETAKILNGKTKFIMREAGKGIIPDRIRNRMNKVGFQTPEEEWIKGELTEMIKSVIDSELFKQRKYWVAEEVKNLFDKCDADQRYCRILWRYTCCELWLETFFNAHQA